jgi:hypothetical protein
MRRRSNSRSLAVWNARDVLRTVSLEVGGGLRPVGVIPSGLHSRRARSVSEECTAAQTNAEYSARKTRRYLSALSMASIIVTWCAAKRQRSLQVTLAWKGLQRLREREGRSLMKHAGSIPWQRRNLIELAKSINAVRDGRVYVPFRFRLEATGPVFGAGLKMPSSNDGWRYMSAVPLSGFSVAAPKPCPRYCAAHTV